MEIRPGQTAVVTGAASGIGLALARRLVDGGVNVVAADVEEGALTAAVDLLRRPGAEVVGVRTDVADPASVERLAERTLSTFGAVHLVVNNAGVETGADFADIPLEAWRWVMDVNLYGVIHGCRTFLPTLLAQGEGHVVNTASLSAFASTTATFAPYAAAKAAVVALSENLAIEMHRTSGGVGVSVLVPGPVQTRMTSSERNRPANVPVARATAIRDAVYEDLTSHTRAAGLAPAHVADMVVEAVRADRFYILTHPEPALSAMAARMRWMSEDERPMVRRPGR